MYVTQTRYVKYASYIDESALRFFVKLIKKAEKNFQDGKKITKKETPVVYGTTIVDFNKEEDLSIARIEMNERGVLRDFIGIDWDFNVGDEEDMQIVVDKSKEIFEKFETPVIIYPTYSYPNKPRLRTVMFTKALMDAEDYNKAVSFIIDYMGVDSGDKDNYSVIKNFNLPVINNQQQKDFVKVYVNQNSKPLDNELWKNTKMHVSSIRIGNRHVKTYEIDDSLEGDLRSKEKIDEGLAHLSRGAINNDKKMFNFNEWFNFFQFLHSVARAEVLGSITHEDAIYILKTVAGGNHKWESRNIEDYLRELPRVKSNETKLKRAKPLSTYFGIEWNL